jgi:hypothetical protein
MSGIVARLQRAIADNPHCQGGLNREWQDVYHVPYGGLVLYVKFVADVVTEFRLLSFKEK